MKNNYLIGAIGALLLCGAIAFGLNMKSKLDSVRTELAASRALYSLVEQEKLRLDSLTAFYVNSIALRDEIIAINEAKIVQQRDSLKTLKKGLHEALNNTAKVNADSSYKYINKRIKPTSELTYPFDSMQVKAIHYVFVERDGLLDINTMLDTLNGNLIRNSYVKDKQLVDLRSLVGTYKSKEDIWKRENAAYIIEVDGLNKEVKQQKTITRLVGGTAVGVVILTIVGSIIN